MNTEQTKRIEKMLDRALNATEKERLGRIQNALGMADNDALWDVLAALEYQRTFYDDLPGKIAATSTAILEGITTAAEKEAAAAQAKLADSVVEQAKRLSTKINYATLVPLGMAALVSLLAYGSLLLWAGFRIGSGQAQDMPWILRMPSGVLMGGLCLVTGLFLGIQAAKEFAEGDKHWWKKIFIALAMLVPGGLITTLALYGIE